MTQERQKKPYINKRNRYGMNTLPLNNLASEPINNVAESANVHDLASSPQKQPSPEQEVVKIENEIGNKQQEQKPNPHSVDPKTVKPEDIVRAPFPSVAPQRQERMLQRHSYSVSSPLSREETLSRIWDRFGVENLDRRIHFVGKPIRPAKSYGFLFDQDVKEINEKRRDDAKKSGVTHEPSKTLTPFLRKSDRKE